MKKSEMYSIWLVFSTNLKSDSHLLGIQHYDERKSMIIYWLLVISSNWLFGNMSSSTSEYSIGNWINKCLKYSESLDIILWKVAMSVSLCIGQMLHIPSLIAIIHLRIVSIHDQANILVRYATHLHGHVLDLGSQNIITFIIMTQN